jgi:hypothetical protein
MARKPVLPDMDKKALEELAQQFPSTSGRRAGAKPDPAADAPAADPVPVAAEPAPVAADPAPAPTPAEPPPQPAETAPPVAASPPPEPALPAAEPAPPPMPQEAVVLAAADATPPPAARAWHEDPRLRMAGLGAVAFLAGYVIGHPGSPGEDPVPAAVAQAVQAARSEASAELDQARTRAAAALREAEQRAAAALREAEQRAAAALAAAREQSVAEARAARAEAERATADLAAFRAQRVEADRAIATARALAAAAEAGRGFSAELAAARQQAGDAPRLGAALDRLAPFAAGVPSRSMLAEAFEPATRRAITLGEDAVPGSWSGRILARLTGGAAAEQAARTATVSAARTEMGRGDLAGAAEALSRLDDVARPAVEPWISSARDRIALDAAAERVTAALVLLAARTP